MDSSAFSLENLIPLVSTLLAGWGLKLLGALVVLFIGRQVAKWIRRGVRATLQRGNMDATLVPFISSLVYYLVLAFVLIAVLGMVGIQTASIIAVLGAAGLAVGLALQGTLSNFASGVMLLMFRPFKVGDYIEAAGSGGTVQAVSILTTTLTSPDNVEIVIPNTAVWGGTIKNYAAQATRRLDLVAPISYSDDIGTAMDTINRVLQGDSRVLPEPAPVVAVHQLGESSVDLVVRPWCKREDFWPLRWDLTRTLKEELERAGCSIPFQQRDVHIRNAAESAT
jgi:small conductance mechanosensitive channel